MTKTRSCICGKKIKRKHALCRRCTIKLLIEERDQAQEECDKLNTALDKLYIKYRKLKDYHTLKLKT